MAILSCNVRPIIEVKQLGAVVSRIELYFSAKLRNPAFIQSKNIQLLIKSQNTEQIWREVKLAKCEQKTAQEFVLHISERDHSPITKLLKFNPHFFRQEICNLSFKLNFLRKIADIHGNLCQHIDIMPAFYSDTAQFKQYAWQDMQYSLYTPNIDDKKHPLIVCLHGAGEGGHHHSHILADRMATCWLEQRYQRLLNQPYILAPQCPDFWLDELTLDGKIYRGSRDYTADLLALIEYIITQHQHIDLQRIYIVGASMGGWQGLKLLATKPSLFAAGLIACPAKILDDSLLDKLSRTPIWLIHSRLDEVIPISNSQYIKNYLTRKGNNNVKLTYYKKVIINQQPINPHAVFLYLYQNRPRSQGETTFQWLIQQKQERKECV